MHLGVIGDMMNESVVAIVRFISRHLVRIEDTSCTEMGPRWGACYIDVKTQYMIPNALTGLR